MNALYQVKTQVIPCSFKDADAKKGIVTGYFSNFGNVDSDGDIMAPGAYAKTIQERGPNSAQPRIKHLQNHNVNMPLGNLLVLQEDTKGLYYESQVGSHNLGQDFIKMVESGLITEHSVGFSVIKKNQIQDYEGYRSNPGKGWYEITEVKLWEGSSLTGWGANELTPLTGMKSEDKLAYFIEKQRAIEKFCKSANATDETIELLLIHCKQLTQIICDIQKEATKPDDTTLPDEQKFAEAINKYLTSKTN